MVVGVDAGAGVDVGAYRSCTWWLHDVSVKRIVRFAR